MCTLDSLDRNLAAAERADLGGRLCGCFRLFAERRCQNLGFKNLYEPSAELTERLRPLQETETDDLMQKVTEEYNRTVKAIEDFQN